MRRATAYRPRTVALVAQLSDLHLFQAPEEQGAIFEALTAALAAERDRRGEAFSMLAITGDVFDSATIQPRFAASFFRGLLLRLQRAAGDGAAVPTIIVPGNHDRRRVGLLAPYRETLFRTLREEIADLALVLGDDSPLLVKVVPPSFHDLPVWVVAYDTTFVPRGLFSAGGYLRPQDLLMAATQIGDRRPEWPVVFLMHHHLVPTPLTDVHRIEWGAKHRLLRWGVQEALPSLLGHADREELMMTALGAGTALSTLHSWGRAVMVLHGHKHYPTARVLDATTRGQGDVMLVGAGSAGTAEAWSEVDLPDVARLWPSFNVVDLDLDRVEVETVSFGWKGRRTGVPESRPLVRAKRAGAHWRVEELDPAEGREMARLRINEAHYRFYPSARFGRERWDYDCRRRLCVCEGDGLSRYVETVAGGEDATLEVQAGARERGRFALPRILHLELNSETLFRVEGGPARQLTARHRRAPDRHPPFGWVDLMNRYACERAELVVQGLPADDDVFASATDLGSGLERPLPVGRSLDEVRIAYPDCPPRTLLRLYWLLEG